MKGRTMMRWVLGTLAILLLAGGVWGAWPKSRAALYSLQRERGKEAILGEMAGYLQKESDHFTLWYTEADENVADLVLATAESVHAPVESHLGGLPASKVPLILYATRDELRRAFGWGSGESAVGVYWRGTIRLLSPNVWIHGSTEAKRRASYQRLNPIAHELTHYALDYLTDGNYPHWFTEGLAQRVEYQVTGFLWLESESTLRQELYDWEELMDQFDSLSNQPLAYRQSYLLVDYLARAYGDESLANLVQDLADGKRFADALRAQTGREAEALFHEWLAWTEANLDELEAAS